MKAVILAAGKGKRMRGLCSATPKPMIPLANRPILSLTFSRLRLMGVSEVALIIGFQGDQLQALIGDGRQYGLRVTYIWQKEQLGTGHATMLAEKFVGSDPFVLIFGDIVTRAEHYAALAKLYSSGTCDAVLSVFPVEDPSNGAAVDVRGGRVVGIVEKPAPGTMLNAYNNAGVFIWPPEIFDLIRDLQKSPRGEYEFTDGIVRFIKAGRRLAAYELQGYWENITDPETCIRMNQNILDEILPPTNPTIHTDARVAPTARVTNSFVASGAVIGNGCNVDGCIIGPAAKLGDNVSAEYAELQPGAIIGGGCQLGPSVSVGENAFIEPCSRLGHNTSIGAGCLVGAGSTIASSILLPGSKVGSGGSLVHVMLDANGTIPPGETISGTPDKTAEVLQAGK